MSDVLLSAADHFDQLREAVWQRLAGRDPRLSREAFDEAYAEWWSREVERAHGGRSSRAAAPVAYVAESVHRTLVDTARSRGRGLGRDEKAELEFVELELQADIAAPATPADQAAYEELVHRILTLVAGELSPRELRVFVYAYLYLLSTPETARALGLSEPRVKKDRDRIAGKVGARVWSVLSGELDLCAAYDRKQLPAIFELLSVHVEDCPACARALGGVRRSAYALIPPVEALLLAPDAVEHAVEAVASRLAGGAADGVHGAADATGAAEVVRGAAEATAGAAEVVRGAAEATAGAAEGVHGAADGAADATAGAAQAVHSAADGAAPGVVDRLAAAGERLHGALEGLVVRCNGAATRAAETIAAMPPGGRTAAVVAVAATAMAGGAVTATGPREQPEDRPAQTQRAAEPARTAAPTATAVPARPGPAARPTATPAQRSAAARRRVVARRAGEARRERETAHRDRFAAAGGAFERQGRPAATPTPSGATAAGGTPPAAAPSFERSGTPAPSAPPPGGRDGFGFEGG